MKDNTPIAEQPDDEISLKELILKIQEWWKYLLSKWVIIVVAAIIGGGIGLAKAYLKQTVYKAELSFTLQEQKSGSALGGYSGIASQLGLSVGGNGTGGAFSGDNLLQLMKSRSMVETALLTPITINGKTETLAELYIKYNKFREAWETDPQLKNISFNNNDRSKFTLKQDSLLGAFHRNIVETNLVVDRVDKELSIITVKVTSPNEQFSKNFAEVLTKVVSDFYVQTQTSKSIKNVLILQKQTDSIRRALSSALSGAASSADANPNPNPTLLTLRVPSQRRQVDVQYNTAILTELAKNLEVARMSLLQETPLIQVIDKPIFPLEKERPGRLKALITGGLIGAFLMIIILFIRRTLKNISGANK